MAEVSLSFDNRGGRMAVDFPEVVVTRRIYRSGESEYLLNKSPCRLVDIQELLSDLGVGRELTAVIGQNKLEAILRSQPEDRRAFLEEAAGLRKHRRRKEKALRKMEGMERNLLRVRDIISEVNKQLRPLERQAQQAREYAELNTEIRELSIRILVSELQELKGQWENRRDEEERLAGELKDTSRGVREGKEKLVFLETRLRELRQALDGCREREMRLLSLGERLRGCESLGEERLKLYAALSGDIAFREGWESRREMLVRRKEELEEELIRTKDEFGSMESEENQLRDERKELAGELGLARRKREGLKRTLADLQEKERRSRAESEQVAARVKENRVEAERLREKRDSTSERLAALEGEIEEKLKAMKEMADGQNEKDGKMTVAREDLCRFREELEAISRKQRRSFQDEALVVARLRALQEVFSSRIDYAAAAARVLDEGEKLPGVLGMLLHKISVRDEWEKALESFLGPWLFCLLTRDLQSAMEAIRVLKKQEGGYGIFLPLSEISSAGVEEAKSLAKIVGGTPALDAVDCDGEIRPALEYLLADVVFCSSLDEAGNKAELYPKLTFVTREGDIIAPQRAVKGGARPRSPFHVIARRREIEELQDMLDLCDEEGISLEVQRKSALSTIAGLEKDLERMAEERMGLESELRDLEAASRELKLHVERDEAERADASGRILSLEAEEAELLGRAADLEAEAERCENEARELQTGLAGEEGKLEELRQRDREYEEALQDILAKKASVAQRRYHLEERIGEIAAEIGGPPLPGREELSRMAQTQEEILGVAKRLMEAHGRLAARLESREKENKEELTGREEELEAVRRSQEGLESHEAQLRELVHNRDLAAAQLKMRVDMLVQRLLDEYKLPLETAITEYLPVTSVEEMKTRLEKLQRRLDMLGQVNPRAVEEHRAMKERHDFLMEQVEDLRESKAALLKVVRAIDREIVRIFKETFEEVNLHFQELFEMLFPQGRAELSLTDATDLLNTGVDIEAQPRGKRLKKLSLLSGGETALTSLAFLFAIFKTRPSPFYFLDEVEAALDDVNLHRFLNMLKEFKGDSQLIVITHQKRTMEIADILYGVSMQASGVSRIISQKLEEAERLARTGTA